TGVVSTVADPAVALGLVTGSTANQIYHNALGVQLAGAMQGQHGYQNQTGVSGSRVLGPADGGPANPIEWNDVAVRFAGPVVFNRIAGNRIGIDVQSGQLIAHNALHRNRQTALQVNGVTDARIVNNTLYSPTGDLIRIEGGSRETQVLDNMLW